jgi:cytochrome P450
MNESLRLKPPANVIGRLTTHEVTIGGYKIPKDVDVWILIRCLHEDEEYWGKDVLEFRPERFLERKIDPHYFIPFGFGARKCLGMKFAEMEATLMLIKAIKQFNIQMPKGKEESMAEEIQEFFLQPKYDIELNLEIRK